MNDYPSFDHASEHNENPFDYYLNQLKGAYQQNLTNQMNDDRLEKIADQSAGTVAQNLTSIYQEMGFQQEEASRLAYFAYLDSLDGGNRVQYCQNLTDMCNQIQKQVWGQSS